MTIKIIKNILIVFGFFVLSCTGLFAQNKSFKVLEYKAPAYPPAARAINATGDVVVEVVIDSDGKVTVSRAVTGHPLLKQASEKAAKEWIFKADKNKELREAKITFTFLRGMGEKASVKFKKPYRIEIREPYSRIDTLDNPDY